MVAYSFKKRFVDPIRVGLGLALSVEGFAARMDEFGNVSKPAPKRQTIRAIGKRRHARPGDTLQLYTAMRTKQCELIGEARCTKVREITIHVGRRTLLIGLHDMDRPLSGDALLSFARADGFSDVADMADFWNAEHGRGKFSGVLIEWEPIR